MLVTTHDPPSAPIEGTEASPSREEPREQSSIPSSLGVLSGSDVNADHLSLGAVPGSTLFSSASPSLAPSSPTTSRKVALSDLEGTYSAAKNGITMTLTIWDADDETAEGSLYSTSMGTRRCVVAALGGNLLALVFLDLSELRVRYTGTSSMTFADSGLVLRRQ